MASWVVPTPEIGANWTAANPDATVAELVGKYPTFPEYTAAYQDMLDRGHTNFIILMVFVGVLALLISAGIGMFIAGQRGRSTKVGFFLGMIPIVGWMIAAFMPQTDENVVNEMFNRNLISLKEYEKTSEVAIQRTQEVKVKKNKKAAK